MEWTVYEDDLFIAAQCRDCPLPGYLILELNKPAVAWADLPERTLERLGPALERIVSAVLDRYRHETPCRLPLIADWTVRQTRYQV